jgi:hypothetical protein
MIEDPGDDRPKQRGTAKLAALFAGLEFTQKPYANTNHPGELLLGQSLLFALLTDQHAEAFCI